MPPSTSTPMLRLASPSLCILRSLFSTSIESKPAFSARVLGITSKARAKLNSTNCSLPSINLALLPQLLAQAHFDAASAYDCLVVSLHSLDDLDSIVERTLSLGNVLFRSASQNDGGGLDGGFVEEIPAFNSDLDFLELLATAAVLGFEAIARGLDDSVDRLGQTFEVFLLDAACAEHFAVCKLLGGEVADRQFGQHDLHAQVGDVVQLLLYDLPLGVNDALLLGRV
eukprot:CAMPEP_0116950430 /NCGR_PEP_ID=MMETSP0467-20121206/39465_1 /TAXON_ID=283647 /ORGANISM="Mesodinium pulex, Strain SPMC105" /LENGTH=226 /DNA_ID=CAMNT_0004635175 /DNA_START=330 /DNA_END=1009 /DNA_ORIENTATION=+